MAPTATLALDLGTTTGWALKTQDGNVVSGAQSFKPGRFEGGGMRFLRFRRWLEELHVSAGPFGELHFEEVRRHAGVDAAHAYGGFLATLTAWCEHHEVPYSGVPVATIKKHATGKGNADKAAVIAAARALGHAPTDDNEADALALLDWVQTMRCSRAQVATRGSIKVSNKVSTESLLTKVNLADLAHTSR
jgi:Holliday junction resolvasome RuvABC endonuclease subunit